MNELNQVTVKYHPVGQGLFSSGILKFNSGFFRWIYDCGSSHKKMGVVKSAIDVLKSSENHYEDVDMLVLSHFDEDHILGCCEILNSFKVKRVILPYMPLWKRIVLAYKHSVDTSNNSFEFYINPSSYIKSISEHTEVIFVSAKENEMQSYNEEEKEGEEERDNSLIFEYEKVFIDNEFSRIGYKDGFIKSGGMVTVGVYWEFIFHNDEAGYLKASDRFKKEIDKLTSDLLEHKSYEQLAALKNNYSDIFGKKDKDKNIISLFMYAAPLSSLNFHIEIEGSLNTKDCLPFDNYNLFLRKNGFLYTGDGSLKKDEALSSLNETLGMFRVDNILCLQVMHHGSKNNWKEGIAEKLNPSLSVFSSNPTGEYKHPHMEVLRDFWGNHPVQVDQSNIFIVDITLI
ncbi:hypothetical protein HB991_02745 [Yersinia mollaretii]|uniref:MBL fold metallo-hydrolase n=3 Tax=Yersinia mollaretii TaxID=33060 RepID=A0AA44CIV1_YERMO|nr:hypothetical protein [Yersinia mollaretii]NIL21441.1 hypothetical protein [Yersinia mollaretii]CNI83509.1 DNA internalization-related competence protein ComEC/Rec2 [Yersinia mollaretii]CQR07410.1 DNA internalization-related competence protein ComEC/Rec2 [Yersinia mollaretii]